MKDSPKDDFLAALDAAAGIPDDLECVGEPAQSDVPSIPLDPGRLARSVARIKAHTAPADLRAAAPQGPAAPPPQHGAASTQPRRILGLPRVAAASVGAISLLGLAATVLLWDGTDSRKNLSYENAFDYALSSKEPNPEKRNTAMLRIYADLLLVTGELKQLSAKGIVKPESEALLSDFRDWLAPRKERPKWSKPATEMEKIRVDLVSPLSSLAQRRKAIENLRSAAREGISLIHDAQTVGGLQAQQAKLALDALLRAAK